MGPPKMKHELKSIVYLSLVPLDRKKAYSVTTIQTAVELRRIGIQLKYFGPFSKFKFPNGWPFHKSATFKGMFLSLNAMLFHVKIIAKFSFALQRFLLKSRLFTSGVVSKEDWLWTRDVRIALSLANRGISVLCEVHHSLSAKEIAWLNNTHSPEKLYLFPISEFLEHHLSSRLSNKHIKISRLPMGANNAFFSEPSQNLKYELEGKIQIGYIGSYETLGIRASLEETILSLSTMSDLSIDFLVVGVGKNGGAILKRYFNQLKSEKAFTNMSLTIVPWVQHELVSKYIKACHIVILPYQENGFNSGRFPIKAVEYAASRIPILCSDTQGHRTIFNDNQVSFYNTDNHESMKLSIENLVGDFKYRKSRIDNAYSFALNHTYAIRAQTLISNITPNPAKQNLLK